LVEGGFVGAKIDNIFIGLNCCWNKTKITQLMN